MMLLINPLALSIPIEHESILDTNFTSSIFKSLTQLMKNQIIKVVDEFI
jgi:hypothetical protein